MGLFDRLFGRERNRPQRGPDLTPVAAVKIVQDYGAVLERSAPPPGCVADVRNLPHAKHQIKEALIVALRFTKVSAMREQLKVGYISLADWQEGVGDQVVGLDLGDMGKLDTNEDILAAAKRVAARTEEHQRWLSVVQADQTALKAELVKLGLW